MTTVEIFSIVSDCIVALSAAGAALTAALGLGVWRKEMRGRHRFDLARRMLTNAVRFQQQLKTARSGLALIPEEAIGVTAEQEDAYRRMWEERTSPAYETFAALVADLPEAEVVFGRPAVDALRPLQEAFADFRVWLRRAVMWRNLRPDQRPLSEEERTKIGAVLWGGDSDDDDISKGVDDGVSQLRGQLAKDLA